MTIPSRSIAGAPLAGRRPRSAEAIRSRTPPSWINGGADYVFGKGMMGYLGVNTPRKGDQSLSCPVGFTLVPPDCVSGD